MIGVFDSGLGGLSVLSALTCALPDADYIYLADSANAPYGDKSEAFIRQRVLALGAHLVGAGCTMLVVACNNGKKRAVGAISQTTRDWRARRYRGLSRMGYAGRAMPH